MPDTGKKSLLTEWHRGGVFPLIGVAAMVFSGCVDQEASLAPPVSMPSGFSQSGSEIPSDCWWTEFKSKELNSLVEEAFRSELTLKVAWERFREADAVVKRETASLFPQVDSYFESFRFDGPDGGSSGNFSDTFNTQGGGAANNFTGGSGGDDNTRESLEFGFDASYEIDLWGRIRSTVDAEKFRAAATYADYQAIALTLSAEVTRTWVQLLEANSRLKLLNEQVDTNEKLVQQLRNQFAGGQARSVDVVRQRQLLSSTRQQTHFVEALIEVLENRLAVLLGRPAQYEIAYSRHGLPSLPPLPKTGIPIDLVRRRPDVQEAFNQLRAANREVAAAISDQYPRLSLSANIYSEDDGGAERLFEDWARAYTANLVVPLIDGGRRRAEVYRTETVENQRLYEYGQTILVAFQEVENALVQERLQIEQIRELELQVKYAEKAYDQLLVE